MTSLDLKGNLLGNENLKNLGDALRVNTTLTTLYLCNNCFIGAGLSLECFVDALKHNKTLTLLDLSINILSRDQLERMVEELSRVQILI